MRLHRETRQRLQPHPSWLSREGDLVLGSIATARRFAALIAASGMPPLGAGELLAGSVIHQIQHRIIRISLGSAGLPLNALALKTGRARLDQALCLVTAYFPPDDVFLKSIPAAEYLNGKDGSRHRSQMLEELWLLDLAWANPALQRVRALFPVKELRSRKVFSTLLPSLESVLRATHDATGRKMPSLPDSLTAAVRAAPDSLSEQLAFLKREWGELIPDLADSINGALDLMAEETPPAHSPPPPKAAYWQRAGEPLDGVDFFSRDSDWMANLVLLAKHAHVWLQQLSIRWQRRVNSLADIPDEELNLLASQGFTGIWLVGLWERSPASLRIKRLGGDHQALASAYAVNRYHVAPELGGDTGLQNLSQRAAAAGIRLGADMVPNHMGLDSPLVRNHPELFIQREDCPYPGYSFKGPELSPETETSIRIEDHYYDRSDAAVVFHMRDRNGRQRYVYHGNDGTHIPWNDTAQLDFLQEKVRDTVMDEIRGVARQVPIIRFDAAMTLTRRHFRRLWYPPPGQGGAIPSRAESALDQAAFDMRMPEEFWRRVVDTIAAEFPDTLLLAEAFWLMESYFVRRLGMHRVYNSAFMHMLRNEENADFRKYIISIWKENPSVLSRFVNFLSNPDEETTARQFGRGDKYFAACTLMLTLPGLPMFAHGQVEGLEEKYGMEFAAPRSSEKQDSHLYQHHNAFIFPLMRQRRRFAGADDLEMFPLRLDNGEIDENVLAFSRGRGRETLMVLVHNRYASTEGRLRNGELNPDHTLADILQVPASCNRDICFHDLVTGTRVIQSATDIRRRGLHFHLNAYGHHLLEYRGPVDVSAASPGPVEKPAIATLENSIASEYAESKSQEIERMSRNGKAQRQKAQKKKPDKSRR